MREYLDVLLGEVQAIVMRKFKDGEALLAPGIDVATENLSGVTLVQER